ncbi:hypothetical protein Btru_004356 [Bulinus truncatus]|nr:hypothetical protein Btru_004356 [Bulinus truncatus]
MDANIKNTSEGRKIKKKADEDMKKFTSQLQSPIISKKWYEIPSLKDIPWKRTIKATISDIRMEKDFYMLYLEHEDIGLEKYEEESMLLDGLHKWLYVTFKDKETARKAFEMNHDPTDSNILKVEMATPEDFDTYPNLLFLYGFDIQSAEDTDLLKDLIQEKTDKEVDDICYHDEPKAAVIIFDEDSCIFILGFADKPLMGYDYILYNKCYDLNLDLNEEELSILEKSEFLLDLKKTYKAIKIKFEHEKNIVIIQANLKTEIQEIILEILKMCRKNITVISLTTLTTEQQKFIRNEHVLLKLNSLLPNAYLKGCNTSFKLFYITSEDSKVLTDIVESQISMTKKPLNSDMVNILQSNKGQKFLSDLIAAFDKTHICPSVKVDAENELLLMLGPKGTIYSLEKDIDRFLKLNQVFVKEIPFSLGKQHFVGRFLHEELNEIKQNIVEVEIIHLSNQYVVKGLKDPVEECYNKLTNLSSKIKYDKVKLKYHGIQEFLQDQEVKSKIKEVEEKNNCVITEGTEYDSSDTYLNQATVPESLDFKAKANSDGAVTVNFMLENILEIKVDALVNPLNSTLNLTSGLSKAILRKENGPSSEIVLAIYSQDLKNIKTATWDIESFCKKNYKEISEKDDPTAKRLTKDQVKLLEQFGVQQRVNVSIKIDEGIFKLQGFNMDGIYQLQKKMQSLVLEAMEHQHKTIQKSLPSAIVWQFKRGSKWIKYEPLLNSDLEQHYKQKARYHKITDSSGDKYEIDYVNMKANLLDDDDSTMERYEIQRVDLSKEGEPLPTDWSPMKDNEDLKVIELKAESSEYKKVEKQVIDTNGNIQIKKILRIQNKTLYQQYAVKKRDLLNQNPKGHQNELQLFHGTAHTAVPKINVHGFNRSYCWINGTMYGKGVCFHKHASYSVSYAKPPDAQNNHYLYLAKVLVGESTPANAQMAFLPSKPGSNRTFDSAVSGDIYVIFHDTQAYPEYLIIF